ncbi:DMT(drug/metabolite transporter) superfamily permease [Thioflavicoccus mobilis 8321]|uniref:DMT(Drug/metabolite transporter) superfamily permease n=1 Tax=Thioflavicoccus mobilis 8321 TaxID=765912 RepID=L0GY63_9GAMM|nr:DMT family transporter [Thioflavicoccus mobilis]AGA90901.1 DMT(drug/metabolite transporter) superfamily permease [Thioflavicoccus mobilis 8321]
MSKKKNNLSNRLKSEALTIPVMLVGSALWGLFWLPLRLLETAGVSGLWAVVLIYTGATATLLLLARPRRCDLRCFSTELFGIGLSAAISGIAFSIGVIEGEVARVLILFYLAPVWSVLLAHRVLKEALAPVTIPALLVALTGAAMMLLSDAGAEDLRFELADLLGLIAGLAFAVTNVQLRAARDLPGPLKNLAACVLVPPLGLALAFVLDVPLAFAPGPLLAGLLVGVLWMTTMIAAVQYGVSRLPVQRSSVLLLFELIVGAASAALIAREMLSAWEILGGLFIILAGLAVARTREPTASRSGR